MPSRVSSRFITSRVPSTLASVQRYRVAVPGFVLAVHSAPPPPPPRSCTSAAGRATRAPRPQAGSVCCVGEMATPPKDVTDMRNGKHPGCVRVTYAAAAARGTKCLAALQKWRSERGRSTLPACVASYRQASQPASGSAQPDDRSSTRERGSHVLRYAFLTRRSQFGSPPAAARPAAWWGSHQAPAPAVLRHIVS